MEQTYLALTRGKRFLCRTALCHRVADTWSRRGSTTMDLNSPETMVQIPMTEHFFVALTFKKALIARKLSSRSFFIRTRNLFLATIIIIEQKPLSAPRCLRRVTRVATVKP
jgi:hypothetical protein